MTDQEIIHLLLARNEDGITAVHEKYGNKILSLADHILRNRQDAEECLNDTILKVWNSIPPTIPVSLSAYILQICRRRALDQLDWAQAKKRNAEVISITEELENCLPAADNSENAGELLSLIDEFLDSQPARNRIMFVRRYWYSDTVEELAERFGMNPNSVRVNLHRVRKKLRQYLEKEGIQL